MCPFPCVPLPRTKTPRPNREQSHNCETIRINGWDFCPLGKGFLTGKMDETTTFDSSDFRSKLPRFTPEALQANHALVERLDSIAAQKKATPAQIALAWLLARKPWIVPIPGTTRLNRLDENLGAVNLELTAADLDAMDQAAAQIKIEGARYPDVLEALTGR